jgi:hypothetical protein
VVLGVGGAVGVVVLGVVVLGVVVLAFLLLAFVMLAFVMVGRLVVMLRALIGGRLVVLRGLVAFVVLGRTLVMLFVRSRLAEPETEQNPDEDQELNQDSLTHGALGTPALRSGQLPIR